MDYNNRGNSQERIALIAKLVEAGATFPSLRLGQLIENAIPPMTVLFFVEDAQLTEWIDAFLRSGSHIQPKESA